MDTPHAQAEGYAGRHSARRARPLTGLRGRRPVVALTAALLGGAALVALPASAAGPVPAFPDNIVVFPDRDFVSVEGYSDRGGETATVEVVRGGSVVGSAKSLISGTDVAFEVNHPGGVCWGAGTSLQVTPNIEAGDVVRVTFADGTSQETTTSSATVDAHSTLAPDGRTLTVTGTVGPDVNPAQMEQRIINPDLVPVIGKRDVRAVPGPLTPAPKGGYSSSLTFPTAGTFLARYVFDSGTAAALADAAEGERAMSWQVEDADGNRQGLTIAEFGEPGGPGMGGCPAGPAQQGPTAGTYSAIRTAGDSMRVDWSPAGVPPGAAPVTGYSVTAVGSTAGADGQFVQLGKRTGASAKQATISGLEATETYTVEVRALTGSQMSAPFPAASGTTSPPVGKDLIPPTLSASPAPGDDAGGATEAASVTLSSDDGQIFYTTDGTPAISGNLPSDDAVLYTSPIPITAPTQLRAVAFDRAGNSSVPLKGFYKPLAAASQPPAAPTGFAGTAGQGKVDLRWATATDATAYQVTVYAADGTALATQPAETTALAQTVTGLTGGTPYDFTVKARKAGTGFGDETPKLRLTPQAVTDQITIGTARWKAGEFRVTGTGTVVGSTVTVHSVTTTGAIGAPIPGATGTVVAAVAPAIGDYDVRLRNGAAPATNPGRVYVKSSGGGVAGPFTVTSR